LTAARLYAKILYIARNGGAMRYQANQAVIRATLALKKRTVSWLAEEAGVPQRTMASIIEGRFATGEDIARRVEDVLEVPFFVLWTPKGPHKSMEPSKNGATA